MVDKKGVAVSCVATGCDAPSPVAVGCVAAIDMLMSGPAGDGLLMSGGTETLGVSWTLNWKITELASQI